MFDILQILGIALAYGILAGLNLPLGIFVTGLCLKFGWTPELLEVAPGLEDDFLAAYGDMDDALVRRVDAYTRANAYASYRERDLGTITAGKYADLVVLSDDIFVIPPQEIETVRVDLTLIGGRPVYERGS